MLQSLGNPIEILAETNAANAAPTSATTGTNPRQVLAAGPINMRIPPADWLVKVALRRAAASGPGAVSCNAFLWGSIGLVPGGGPPDVQWGVIGPNGGQLNVGAAGPAAIAGTSDDNSAAEAFCFYEVVYGLGAFDRVYGQVTTLGANTLVSMTLYPLFNTEQHSG